MAGPPGPREARPEDKLYVPATYENVPAMVPRDPFIAVYMMSNRKHGTLYIGVTSNLVKRAWQHRDGVMEGFTKKYSLKRLVWYERHESMVAAIQREKSLKKYKRDWKINLIERDNPDWTDLYMGLARGVHGWPGQARP
ncbi:MAG TPA: GIY-YIG nuclease family protein [Candidatus Binataceae bacterium]|jgi:putative endonuclease